MKKVVIIVTALLLSVVIGVSTLAYMGSKEQPTTPVVPVDQPAKPSELLTLVNNARKEAGVKPLVVDEKLNKSAQWKAEKMAKTRVFKHIDPKTGKNDGLDYLGSLNPGCSYISENISWDSGHTALTTEEAFNGWMNSKPHREAILDPAYTRTGFGVTDSTAVEHFCIP